MKKSTTSTVDKISALALTGNVTPPNWYKTITYTNKNGTYPHLLAIAILSDICYWYKRTEIRDEKTGHISVIKKKFNEDKLQRSHSQIITFFGCSKRQSKDAIKLLKDMGLITVELREKDIGGVVLYNVMYLEPVPKMIEKVTYIADNQVGTNSTPPPSEIAPRVHPETTPPPSEIAPTYTETSSETSSGGEETPPNKENKEPNHYHTFLDAFGVEDNQPLSIAACKIPHQEWPKIVGHLPGYIERTCPLGLDKKKFRAGAIAYLKNQLWLNDPNPATKQTAKKSYQRPYKQPI